MRQKVRLAVNRPIEEEKAVVRLRIEWWRLAHV
jgi:hypothetical protein